MRGQAGFFDVDERLRELSAKDDDGDGGPLAFQVTDAAWLFLRVPAATHANHDGRLRPFGMRS